MRGPSVLRATAVAGLLGAELIHWSVIDVHAREWVAAGYFFTAVAIVEVILAIGVGVSRRRAWLWLALATSAATLAVWAVTRTVGLPFGPAAGQPEAIGRADVVAALLELLTVAGVAGLLRAPAAPPGAVERASAAEPVQHRFVSAVALYVAALTAFAMTPALAGSLSHDADDTRPIVTLTVANSIFDRDHLELGNGASFDIRLVNRDAIPHNLTLYRTTPAEPAFRGKIVDPRATRTYRFATPGPGIYRFRCDIHPAMTGTAEIG